MNETFQLYLTIVGGLLVIAGLLFLFLDRVLHKNLAGPWAIYRGWLIMAPLTLAFVFLGRLFFIPAIAVLSFLAFREFYRATPLKAPLRKNRPIAYVIMLGILAVAVVALIPIPTSEYFGWYGLFVALPVYVTGLIFLVPILQNRYEGQLQAVSLGMLGFTYFGWMLGHMSFFANSPYFINYVLYIVFAVQLGDISGYTFGRLFGRRKLRSNISPNKTVAGSLGTLGISMVLPWILRPTLPGFGPTQLILTGLIVGVGCQLGDLSISLIKRDVGIKDMGRLIPGHGGVLDRIDSLIVAAPFFYHMVRYYGLLYP